MIFTPPTRFAVPTTVAEPHPGNALFRHFGPRREGVNVYRLADGSFSEDDRHAHLAVHAYHGGHLHEVSDDEGAALVAAGYEVSP